jgi:hypothetical protein
MLIKFRIPEIVLGIFLTVAVFAIGYVVASSGPSPSQQVDSANDLQTANEGVERTAEKQIAYYTKWLAWFTGALVAVSLMQGYFLLRADKTARIAANAADLSARAAVALELPIIRVEPVGFGWGSSQVNDESTVEYFGLQSFDLLNLGRTDAFPLEIRWGWFVGDKLPDVPIYVHRKPFVIAAIIRTEKRSQIYVTGFEMLIEPEDTARIVRNNTKLWLYCSLAYDDFMQTRHDLGVCWLRYETFGAGGFRLDATATTYNRKT